MFYTNALKEKYLLALRCLLAADGLDKEHPKVHEQIVRFKLAIDKNLGDVPPTSADIIKSEFTLLPTSVSLTNYNDDFLAKSKDSATNTLSGLRVRMLLSPELSSSIEKAVTAILTLPSVTLAEAKEALELLKSWSSSEAPSFQKNAAAKWPKSSVFGSEK
jgi:hypothetical protein